MATKNETSNDYEVLIVGAGPTGLTLALELARHGVNFRIIDKKSGPVEHSQALAIQPHSLEIFHDLGVASTLIEQGKQLAVMNGFIDRKQKFQINFRDGIESPYHFVLILEQNKTEKVLLDALSAQGITVDWNTEFEKLSQTKSGVKATIKSKGKKQTITTDWIVGCDGLNSTVRDEAGISFSGGSYPERFFLADAKISWKLPAKSAYGFIDAKGLFITIPMANGQYRIITVLDNDESDDLGDEGLLHKFSQFSPVPGTISDITWSSSFNIHRKIASQMKVDRVFIAGDAAHVHSPIGGQGMNTGIQDAYNLGWKLGYFSKGIVNAKFLDSYEEERMEIAKNVLKGTDLAMRVLLTRSSFWKRVRNIIAPVLMHFSTVQNHLKRIIAETSIRYRDSSIIFHEKATSHRLAQQIKEGFKGGVNLGDRAIDISLLGPKTYKKDSLYSLTKGTKHTLLLFLGEKHEKLVSSFKQFQEFKKKFDGFADVYFIVGEHAIDYNVFDPNLSDTFLDPDGRGHYAYKCWEPTLILIRPDGYVGYRENLEENNILQYYEKFFSKLSATTPPKKKAV